MSYRGYTAAPDHPAERWQPGGGRRERATRAAYICTTTQGRSHLYMWGENSALFGMMKRCCFFMLLSKQHMRIMTKRLRR